MKAYAGIGSRGTPPPFLIFMQKVAEALSEECTLRTGGADGADSAFIEGAKKNMEIYIPSNGFNGFYENKNKYVITEIPSQAFDLAEKFHPAYQKLSPFAKRLMARNCMQILGKNLDDPVKFVICYTKDGKASGGTGQALRLAGSMNIPIYNIQQKDAFQYCKQLIT
jgi:hypothetical protein